MNPPPTTEYHGKAPNQSDLLRVVRAELLEEANKLERILKGRTINGDVCLDVPETKELIAKLRQLAGRVSN